jgi:membrane protein DedA with SNARE-associated domain
MGLVRRHGEVAVFGLLYAEESGVPLPVPGDAYVMFLGHRLAVDLVSAGLTCAGITAVVVLGATNLYFISRRWGRRLVEGRAGKFFHVTPRRLEKAQAWFQRWGALALIFGRHIPGFRVPITVAAGTFGVSYRIFVLSVMISTITWSGIFIGVGKMLGGRIEDFMSVHRHTTPIILGVVGGAIVLFTIYRFWQLRNEHGQEPETSAY